MDDSPSGQMRRTSRCASCLCLALVDEIPSPLDVDVVVWTGLVFEDRRSLRKGVGAAPSEHRSGGVLHVLFRRPNGLPPGSTFRGTPSDVFVPRCRPSHKD